MEWESGRRYFVAALRWDRHAAPAAFVGPMDRECFLAYIEQILAPTLRPGDILVMDNLASHKVAGHQGGNRSHRGDLPPYSPDLNPIEQAIAQAQVTP